MIFSADILLLILTFLVNISLGLLILFNGAKNRVNISFCFVAMSLGFWALTWAIALAITDMSFKLLWTRLMLAGPSITPAAFLYFSIVFPEGRIKINPLIVLLFFAFPAVASLLAAPTDLYVKSISLAPWGIDFIPGAGYPVYTIYFSAYLGLAFLLLFIKYRRSTGTDKERIRYLFLGTFLAALIGLLANLILPLFGFTGVNKLGPMGTSILVIFTALAISKHELMDIRLLVNRTGAWIFSVSLFGSIYVVLVSLYRDFVSPQINLLFLFLSILFGILVGETFVKLRLFVQRTANRAFIHGWYDFEKAVAQVSERFVPITLTEDLFHTIKSIVNEKFETEDFTYFAADQRSKDGFPLNYWGTNSGTLGNDQKFVKYLSEARRPPFSFDVLPDEVKHEIRSSKFLKGRFFLPLYSPKHLEGFFVFETKGSQDSFNETDLNFLQTIQNQAISIFDRIRPYEELQKDFEDNQKKLAETEKLLARSARLASLGTLTTGVTHEIRNPLGVIRMGINLLPNEPRDTAYLKEFQIKHIKHVDRIANIIDKMLYLSKSKDANFKEIDLDQLIEEYLLELVSARNIKVIKRLTAVPKVLAVFDELHQVLVNLTDNAIKAMPEGGAITYKTYAITEEGENKVVVEVIDTGTGIPQENIEKIFNPFFSTRHNGVGLGLSISYKIIESHKGRIEVQSQLGKGSTFRIVLPAI